MSPEVVIINYCAEYTRVNGRAAPVIKYEGGWFRFKEQRNKGYRRVTLLDMTRTLYQCPSAPSKEHRWPSKGDTMKFLGKNGYPLELEDALKVFTPGNEYRVHDCNVQSFSHSVQFDGVKGWFNGVMFELCAVSSTDRGGAK